MKPQCDDVGSVEYLIFCGESKLRYQGSNNRLGIEYSSNHVYKYDVLRKTEAMMRVPQRGGCTAPEPTATVKSIKYQFL